jgi:DUF438 domain-containing protein
MLWQRGSLSLEQAHLVLASLPCDVSLADENDVLLFWSGDTYKTCDARFIGRDVRDCHPPESMETLETILREFKAGTRDVAEGWGEEHGRFKLTRYTAVRDADSAYKGILEVNMDVTGFRDLSGAQQLPGW